MNSKKLIRKYSKLTAFLLICTITLTLTACRSKNSPEQTVDALFESAKVLDYEALGELIDGDVKDDLENGAIELKDSIVGNKDTEEIDFNSIEGVDKFKSNLKEIQSKLTYKVIKVEESDDSAVTTVDVKYVNGQDLIASSIGDLIKEVMGQAFTNQEELTEEESISLFIDMFNKNYEQFETVPKEDTIDIHLIKDEEGDWLISELDEDLINVLSFNTINGIDNIISNMFGGFRD